LRGRSEFGRGEDYKGWVLPENKYAMNSANSDALKMANNDV